MTQQRRSEERHPLSLNAQVHPSQGRPFGCLIRDFCYGGMLLEGDGENRFGAARGSGVGEVIKVQFGLRTAAGPKQFRIEAEVVRELDRGTGIGVRFPRKLDAGVFRGLQSLSEQRSPKVEPRERTAAGTGSDADAMIDAVLKQAASDFLPRMCTGFFKRIDHELLIKARDATSNQMQLVFFEGMNSMERARRGFADRLTQEVHRQIDEPVDLQVALARRRRTEVKPPQQLDSGELSLVDREQFEDWLAIAEVITRMESLSVVPLLEITRMLGQTTESWGHKEALPIGPGVVCQAFDDLLKPSEQSSEVKDEIYRALRESAQPVFKQMYNALVEALEETGLFSREEPDTASRDTATSEGGDFLGEEVSATPAVPPAPAAPVPPAPVPAAPQLPQAPQIPVAGAAEPALPGQPLPAGTTLGQLGSAPAAGIPLAPGLQSGVSQPAPAPAPQMGGFAPGPALDPAAGLVGVPLTGPYAEMPVQVSSPSAAYATAARIAGPATSVAMPAAGPTFNSDEVLAALAELQMRTAQGSAPPLDVKPQLMDVLRGGDTGDARSLPMQQAETLDVVSQMVDSIQQDALVTEGIKSWIKRFEVTLQRMALADPAFMDPESDAPHPAVDVLNQLARIGIAADEGDGIDRQVGRQLEDMLGDALRNSIEDPTALTGLQGDLEALVERQKRAYEGNVARTVKASEGQQRLGLARQAVVREMGGVLGGQQVPELLMRILQPAWRNLLVRTHLTHGEESDEWRGRVGTVDRLLKVVTDQARDPAALEAVLGEIDSGLEDMAWDANRRTSTLRSLKAAIERGRTGRQIPVENDGVGRLLDLEGSIPEDSPAPDTSDAGERDEWQEWLARAREIKAGDWLAIADASGQPRIRTVAFVGENHASFVLVNRKGVKVGEYTLKEMTDGLHRGETSILDEADMPLMERASHRMLQNMHNELAWQASHDDTTGLINRREFENLLDEALITARSGEHEHVLMFIDLDQFKVINSTAGHEAGDRLLEELAAALKHAIRGQRARLARLGGDEFGILLEQATLEDGRETGRRLLKTIRDYRLEWEERQFSVSGSIGAVPVRENTPDVAALMQCADDAVYAAKDSGRNRLQVYEVGDARMAERRGVMEWVSEIDNAIAEQRLVLSGQRIAPIDPNSEHTGHYEVLLLFIDREGRALPPADLIHAAETFDRMVTIDRWVVSETFAWMARNSAAIEEMGGSFAINLSAHSLQEETFSDFVKEQLQITRVPPGRVIFEVTETAAMTNLEQALETMNALRLLDFTFALDDFGTGMSSFAQLRNLPVDYVKIDGVFIRDIVNNPGDYAVVRSVNEIGHFMGLRVIAEFVENEEIIEQLREIGVDYAQGYAIGKPIRLEELFDSAA